MYVDETGGTEETVTSEDMTVTVDGEDYQTEMNADINEDGTADTAVVARENGSKSVYIDGDGDRDADYYVEVDSSGEVVAEAEYDAASGQWVAVDPHAGDAGSADTQGSPQDTPTSDDTQTGSDGPMTAELPSGEVEVGPATVDTNEDGVNDTAVAEDADGNTYYFTDVDNDGDADYVVVVAADGSSQALEHQGGGEWKPLDTGGGSTSDSPVADTPDASGVTSTGLEGVAKIDAQSGQWISQN